MGVPASSPRLPLLFPTTLAMALLQVNASACVPRSARYPPALLRGSSSRPPRRQHHMTAASSAHDATGPLAQLRASLSPATALSVDSLPLAAASFVGVAGSLFSFNVLAGGIAASAAAGGFAGDPAALLLPDLHFGYAPDEVATLLGAYGHEGRLQYLAVEALDVSLYHTSYRALFLVLLNRVTAVLAAAQWVPEGLRGPLRASARAPLLVAALDGLEDVGQVALTLACDVGATGAPWWPALTAASSAFNVAKWTCVRTFSPLALLMCIAAAATSLRGGDSRKQKQ